MDQSSSSEENFIEEDEELMENIQNGAPEVPNADRTSQLGSPESAPSEEQPTTVPEQLVPGGIRNSYEDDEGKVENTLHEKPVVPNRTSQLWAASNIPSSSIGGSSAGEHRVEEPTLTSQSSWLSENGNPVCHPISDEMEVPCIQHNSLEKVGEEFDNAMLDSDGSSMSDSSYTAEQVVRYPVECEGKTYLRLNREVRNIMARNPNKLYHLTPCKKLKHEIGDPLSCYGVDVCYHDTTSHSTMSQQPANSTICSHDNRVKNSTEFQHPSNLASSLANSPQGIATGSAGQNRSPLNTDPIQMESLGACAMEPSHEVHEGRSFPTSDVLFVHEGYAMFKMTVPKGITFNTLLTMNQFTQQKHALLGNLTFLHKEWMNLRKIEEDHVTIILKVV